MTLPFTWTLRGHCRVINWPDFNIVVSQKIGRPRRGREMGEWPVSGAVRTHIFIVCRIIWAQFVVPQNNYNSNIKDHWSQITTTNIIIMKKFEILWKLPKCDPDTWNEQMLLEKYGADRLAWFRVAKNFPFLFFFFWPRHGLWDLSSQTSDWTRDLGSESTES